MTRQRLLLILVTVVLVSLPLLHPYLRQTVFGPAPEGRPLCYWQEEVRRRIASDEVDASLSHRILEFFGMNPRENQGGDGLPLSEPEDRRLLLISLLDDPAPRVRALVAKGLGALPPSSDVVAGLTALLADADRSVRLHAVQSMTRFRPRMRGAIPKLTELLEDEDSEICVAVAEFIASSRSERKSRIAFMTFRELLKDADPEIRVRAVQGLHRTAREGDDIFPLLAGSSRDPQPAVRRAALMTMWDYGRVALPLLVQAVRDDDAGVRREALMILGSHGRAAHETSARIVPLLEDPDRDVADAAEKALEQIDAEEYARRQPDESGAPGMQEDQRLARRAASSRLRVSNFRKGLTLMATATDRAAQERWEKENAAAPLRPQPPTTVSGAPIAPLYTPESLEAGFEPETDLGYPGQYPFTRGVHASMYRSRLWTMRQFAGFGTARQTNERFGFLLGKGQTGLSTAFDLPTLMGLDSDDPRSLGEVGRLGVAVDTLDDMRTLFDGIDLAQVSVSMTINAPAIIVMAFFLANARARGIAWSALRGTLQNDILKEFHAQNEIMFPPVPSVRLVCDVIEFCTQHVPQWNSVSISGYHIREAGSSAAQELAFTLADGFHYVDQCLERGLDVDDFAPRLSFFFNAHNDVFEELAKYRAARAVWAEALRTRYGARKETSWKLRFHAQTAGCSLQDKQPEVNLIRVAYQALAAVLGGCQSLHTNSMDETLALPSEHAVTLALRTQQVLAYETGVTNTVDPLGGSYFVETLTRQMMEQARSYFAEIERRGGMIAALEAGFFRREIADSAFAYQREVDARRKLIVGVNAFQEPEEKPLETLVVGDVEEEQLAALRKLKARRDAGAVARCLSEVRRVAQTKENLMPALLEAAEARCSVGELMAALADVFGKYDRAAKW